MEPIEILKREHHTVLRVATATRRDLDRADETGVFAGDRMERSLKFFRYFTNACHNPKEEDLLFTALHHRGLAWDAYPLRELVREHEAMRVALDSASDQVPLERTGDASAAVSLAHDLRTYLDLLERHIAAEEGTLFPLAQELLTRSDVEQLAETFATLACDELAQGDSAYYADVASELAGTTVRAS